MNVADVPLNVTLVAPVRSVPRILTAAPTLPDAGTVVTKGASPTERRKTVPQPGGQLPAPLQPFWQTWSQSCRRCPA